MELSTPAPPTFEIKKYRPRIIVAEHWSLNKMDYSNIENPDIPEALMAFAEQVLGNGQARVAVTTDFGMKDFGNGPNGSVTISLACNQDDATIQAVAAGLSTWGVGLAEQHFKAADAKFQQMFFEKHPEKQVLPTPPIFKAP